MIGISEPSWLEATADALVLLVSYSGPSEKSLAKDAALSPFVIEAFVPRNSRHLLKSSEALHNLKPNDRYKIAEQISWERQTAALHEFRKLVGPETPRGEHNRESVHEFEGATSDAFLFDITQRYDIFGSDRALVLWAYGNLRLRNSRVGAPWRGETELATELLKGALEHWVVQDLVADLIVNGPTVLAVAQDPRVQAEHVLSSPPEVRAALLDAVSTANVGTPALSGFVSSLLACRVRVAPSERDVETNDGVRLWLDENASSVTLSSKAVFEAASTGASATRFIAEAVNRLSYFNMSNETFSWSDADAEIASLTAWLLFMSGSWRDVSDNLFASLLKANKSIASASLEPWRNDWAAKSLETKVSRDHVRRLISVCSSSPGDLLQTLPTGLFRLWLLEVRAQARGETRGRAGHDKARAALMNLWRTNALQQQLQSLANRNVPQNHHRVLVFIEVYLDALRESGGPPAIMDNAIKFLKDRNISRTPRIWESRVAATKINSDREKIRSMVREDLGSEESFTAGLWTTFIVGALQTSPDPSKTWQSRIDEALTAGETLLTKALECLTKAVGITDVSDAWFSSKEARRILLSYPTPKSYARMEIQWTSEVNRVAAVSGVKPETFTMEMLLTIARAHANEGYEQGVDRIKDIWRKAFEHDRQEEWTRLLTVCATNVVKRRAESLFPQLIGAAKSSESLEDAQGAVASVVALLTTELQTSSTVQGVSEEAFARTLLNYLNFTWDSRVEAQTIEEREAGIVKEALTEVARSRGVELRMAQPSDMDSAEDLVAQREKNRMLEALRGTLRLMSHDIGQPFSRLEDTVDSLGGHLAKAEEALNRSAANDSVVRGVMAQVRDEFDALLEDVRTFNDPVRLFAVATEDPDLGEQKTLAQLTEAIALGMESHGRQISVVDFTEGGRTTVQQVVSSLMIHNLLLNSVEHGQGEICVTIYAAAEQDAIELTVSDQGTGLPDEVAEGLNKYRPARGPDKFDEGPKTGLMAAKFSAEALGGRLEPVRDPAGLLFLTLSLPLNSRRLSR